MAAYKKIGDTGVEYSKENLLGRGTYSDVYHGIFNTKQVAVKKILLNRSEKEEREVDLHKILDHENILKILQVVEDDDFRYLIYAHYCLTKKTFFLTQIIPPRYIVLELCAGTLSEVIENTYKGPAQPPDTTVLYQIADGLNYIHSKKLVHRDIKPDNILVSQIGYMKLSDFGLSKQISIRDTFSMSGQKGTHLWMAPEFYDNIEKATPKCDVFSCGCVFFVFLTRENGGIHPFGDTNVSLQVQFNIQKGKPVNIDSKSINFFFQLLKSRLINKFFFIFFSELDYNHFAFSFVRGMTERDPSKRISLQTVKTYLEMILSGNFPQLPTNFARKNNATEAKADVLIEDLIYASGSFKNFYKGKYTDGERAGEDCVGKSLKSGSVFEESYFQVELQVVETALEIINNFNKEKVIDQNIWLNIPEIGTFVLGSGREGEKMLVEPMISNFENFNSNTGWTSEESSPWIDKMQALSHYSYHYTNGHLLLCDLQGGVIENGAVLTDPIIMSSTSEYGPKDLGDEGISNFFTYHTCNKFCDSKWMIPHDKKRYFDKRIKGTAIGFPTKLTKLKLVNPIPQDIVVGTHLRRVTLTLKRGQVKINEVR
jgi:serine/threonine protein kinase